MEQSPCETDWFCSESRNFPHFWNPKVHHHTHKCPPPVPILSQLHPVLTTPSLFLRIHLNIILPSASGPPKWSLSLRFPHQKNYINTRTNVVVVLRVPSTLHVQSQRERTWAGCGLKDGHAQCTDNTSREPGTVRGTERRPHFSLAFISVTVKVLI